MRFFLIIVLIFTQFILFAQDKCTKGFERLVILSNNEKITDTALNEAIVITDSLTRIGCDLYKVDRNGKVYAGASLSYLFGKVCATNNTEKSMHAFIRYANNSKIVMSEDIGQQLDGLLRLQPEYVLKQLSGNQELLEITAWGFLDNEQFSKLSLSNYETIFYQKHPGLKEIYPLYKNDIDQIFATIKTEL